MDNTNTIFYLTKKKYRDSHELKVADKNTYICKKYIFTNI